MYCNMADEVVIKVENLWKQYGLPLPKVVRRLGKKLGSKGVSTTTDPWALKDVSFEIKKGETIGIIGRNGSGKSTLLKILAGVTPPTRGTLEVLGRVFPMIELNAGMHPELTGRENVHLLGTIMGLSRIDFKRSLPSIEDFCELGDFFDRPIRTYSSGMLARLGFSVALNVRADILLIDEVMAVGDINFQRKCIEHMVRMNQSRQTILLVSHNVRQLERICDRGINIEEGSIVVDGAIREVSSNYFKKAITDRYNHLRDNNRPVIYYDSKEIEIDEIQFLNSNGHQVDTVETGKDFQISIRFTLNKNIPDLIYHIGFVTSDLLRLTVFNSIDADIDFKGWKSGTIICRINKLPLMPGIMGLFISITRSNNITLFKAENMKYIKIIDNSYLFVRRNMDFVALDVDWNAQRDR